MVIYRESIFNHLPKSQVMKEYYVQLKKLIKEYNKKIQFFTNQNI